MPCYDSRNDTSEIYERLNLATRVACEVSKLLNKTQIEALSNEAVMWIDGHRKMDEERERRERRLRDQQEVAAKAKNKLTPAEREALGLR